MAMPMGMWFVPLGNVMHAYGRPSLLPYVLATGGLSAFISPLMIGAMADRRVAPVRIMRWLCLGTSVGLCLFSTALERQADTVWILSAAMFLSLVFAPIWGLATSIVLSNLPDPGSQFGPVRAWATLGWMAGGWMVSYVLLSDSSVVSGYAAAVFWLLVAAWTFRLPENAPPPSARARGWWQTLGLDALDLLKDRNHRMVFITAALYSMPLAAFYPYCVRHLHDLGLQGAAGLMTLGQITEVLVMLVLAGLMRRYRLKWVFASGIALGLLRYVVFSFDGRAWVLSGIILHGLAYTLYFITTQIYLEDRISPEFRTRAQALLTLLTAGVGNLCGYLGSGWWYAACSPEAADLPFPWARFWGGLSWVTGAVLLFFLLFYRGITHGIQKSPPSAR
jgi:MFS family permease